jgi:hypothetical protein
MRRALAVAGAVAVVAAGVLAWALVDGGAEASATPIRAGGAFRRLAEPTWGNARLVLDGDHRVLTFSGFHTNAAPELFVYLVPGVARGGAIDGGTKLGRLKAVDGAQRYAVPDGLADTLPVTAVVWCALCSKPWGAATLT